MDKMKKQISILLVFLSLMGCASLQDMMNVITGNSSQKITRTPLWVYKPDLLMQVGNEVFRSGTGAVNLPLSGPIDIKIWSQVDIDRVEISTCSRHDVCQKKGGDLACDASRFDIHTDWFGNPGKYMVYHFTPDIKERSVMCANAIIAVYDKNALAAWGYMVFKVNTENTFTSKMTCNASDISFDGVSVCAVKSGTIQQIRFDEKIDTVRAEDVCNLKKQSEGVYDLKPQVGWCRASFGSGLKFHDVVIDGYDEVLIRDGKE